MSEAAEQPAPPPEEPFPDIFQVLNDDSDFDIQDSDGQSLDALEQDQPALEGATDLEDVIDQLDELDGAAEEVEPPVFIVNVGTDGSWTEQAPVNGTLVNAGTTGDCRTFSTTDTVSGAALIQLGAGQAVVIQKDDVGSAGGFTRFIQISPFANGPTTALGRITGHTGSHSAYVYAITFQDGSTGNGYNIKDWNGTTPGAMIGSPCSLGINVGSSGQVGSTACVIQAIGSTGGYFTLTFDPKISRWTWNEQPSAQ